VTVVFVISSSWMQAKSLDIQSIAWKKQSDVKWQSPI